MWLANGSMETLPKEESTRIPFGEIQRILHSWWKKGAATPISNIDNFLKHIHRERDQEAAHWADIGAKGRRKNDICRKDAATKCKAIRCFWDGSFKDDGWNSCGIVINVADREKRVTICKIAVPLKVGAAMTAEVIGV